MVHSARHILLVEDDKAIADGLALNLELEGFEATIARDGEAALQLIKATTPTLVLLDITLPKKDGLQVLAELRAADDTTPVIVLSARQNEFDKVAALRVGADDYVTKPFGVAELLARIDAVLRRIDPIKVAADPTTAFVFGNVTVDPVTREVVLQDSTVPMTKLEFDLLLFLLRNPNRVFSREELLAKVWGVRHTGSPRTVDNFVGQLRAKLETCPTEPRYLITVRGDGYRFVMPAPNRID